MLAYIDPGTGAQLVGNTMGPVIAFIGLALGAIALFFKKIVAFVKGLFGKK